ncbi:uncharacterized protein LOC117122804 isoform X2 [Anneissia japonica]|uniref:uncharacterized protein LOC117122804 isoform X2 n=1 Tax=Anneissia japonica TaxID=1529436 RepID=UPI001425BA6E|nr:uncharacterized protein LOC117122804 isoform X2 [Anneissia japonica]
MTTSEPNQVEDNVDETNLFECRICFRRIRKPRSFSCLLISCLACVKDSVKMNKLTCPNCLKSNRISKGHHHNLSKGLMKTIKMKNVRLRDVIKCEDDSLLVSCLTNEILNYKQSGEYIGKVTLPQGVEVNRMYKMKNGDIAFSDWGNSCITICNMNGQVIKSIGEEVFEFPYGIFGIHVDESSNVVYVPAICDYGTNQQMFIFSGNTVSTCVYKFDLSSGEMITKIPPKILNEDPCCINYRLTDIALTNQGHLLLLDDSFKRIQLFDNEGRYIKSIINIRNRNRKVKFTRPCRIVKELINKKMELSMHVGCPSFQIIHEELP